MLVPVVSLVATAKDVQYSTAIPTVYLAGQGLLLWDVPGHKREEAFYPLSIPDGYIGDAGKELIAPLLKGIATDDWDEYSDKLADAIIGIVGAVGLDENGEAKPEVHSWNNNPRLDIRTDDGRYMLYSHSHNQKQYYYNYDWRTDPYAVAADLKTYIETVKTTCGVDKVNLVGRCLGSNIILTFLSEYGSDSIEKTVLVSNGFYGFETVGTLFSGQFEFDVDALTRYADDYLSNETDEEDPIYGLLDVVIRLLNQMKALGMPVSMIDKFWSKVNDKVTPKVLLSSYATMPSFWAFVPDEYYDAAKEFLFAGKEEQYAGLIEKIDRYHYDIGQRYEEIIDTANAAGNQVSIIAKYGLQIIPTVKDADIMADGFLETVSSSFGATCSTIDGTLSKDYLAAAKENGTDKYISVDKQIDASTCKYPDYTWFIKYMGHMDNPDCIDDILVAILDYDGDMTVFDDENFPQYLVCEGKEDDAELYPLTKENAAGGSSDKTVLFKDNRLNTLIDLLRSFLKTFIFYVKKMLAK